MNQAGGARVRYGVRDDVAYLTLDAPPLNILTAAMMDEITEALGRAAADRSLKAVAVTANGKAFSAGADLDEHRPEKVRRMVGALGGMFRALDACELPIVMTVSGAALGAGFEFVLMADVLLAAERATFGLPEIRLGFFAPVGILRLPDLVGTAKAMEISCTGRTYSAAEMNGYGLVARVVPGEELESAMESTLNDLRQASPLIMRLNVSTLKQLRGRSFGDTLRRAEAVFLERLMATEDVHEGVASFYEKRRPVWRNR